MNTVTARLRLGELLTAAGLLPHAKLEEALQAQGERRLGEVLIDMGFVEHDELPGLLEVQSRLRDSMDRPEALSERLRIGQLLLNAGIIDSATLDSALAASRASGRRLGETLVDRGAISESVLQRFLRRQRRLSAVALAGLALSAWMHLPTAVAADRARVDVRATVLDRAYIERQRLPQQVEISAVDVARGYVDVDEPVEVGIRSNHPAGVAVGFALNSAQVSSVDVRAAEGAVIGATGVVIPQRERGLRQSTVSIRVRLRLAPDAAPGTIAYPLALTLTPL